MPIDEAGGRESHPCKVTLVRRFARLADALNSDMLKDIGVQPFGATTRAGERYGALFGMNGGVARSG